MVELPPDRSHYLGRVLRLAAGHEVQLFDGQGNEFRGEITLLTKNGGTIALKERCATLPPSPLAITLVQAVSRGERMDLTLQKATELGVTRIRPVFSERTEVRLKGGRLDKRLAHWEGVIAAACEQCGRADVPELLPPVDIVELYGKAPEDALALLLAPDADCSVRSLEPAERVSVAVGPEGGFTATEADQLARAGWQPIRLGPRILRTETAGPAAITALQALWGDW